MIQVWIPAQVEEGTNVGTVYWRKSRHEFVLELACTAVGSVASKQRS